jgi:hypothetical protein
MGQIGRKSGNIEAGALDPELFNAISNSVLYAGRFRGMRGAHTNA